LSFILVSSVFYFFLIIFILKINKKKSFSTLIFKLYKNFYYKIMNYIKLPQLVNLSGFWVQLRIATYNSYSFFGVMFFCTKLKFKKEYNIYCYIQILKILFFQLHLFGEE
jgi:hypothetical protein